MMHDQRAFRRAFTVMEMAAVIAIAALIAVPVIPTVARIGRARQVAALSEVKRTLEFARGRAIASGTPAGVRFNADSGLIEILVLDPDGAVIPAPSPLGEPTVALSLQQGFDANIGSVRFLPPPISAGVPEAGVIWFDHAGAPHVRTSAGGLVGHTVSDGQVEVVGVGVVTVIAASGLLEVSR